MFNIPDSIDIMKTRKTFKYDVLIDENDICDRGNEIRDLLRRAKSGKRTVLFAPRRYGKTSLVKNVVGRRFKKADARNLLIYVDLMDVKNFRSIAERLQYSLSKSLTEHFPVRTLLKNIAGLIKNITISIETDPATGQPSLSLSVSDADNQKGSRPLMEAISKLSEKHNLMLILDEFHDIAFVDEAEAVFRSFLQELTKASVFILGSKRHLLKLMLADANAPLFNFGDEMSLSPIRVKDWLGYYRERLSISNLSIAEEGMGWIAARMCDVPNAICELGAWLVENCSNTHLSIKVIKEQLDSMLDSKQGYHYILQGYTEIERQVLKKIAESGFVLEPQSSSFLEMTQVSKSSVQKVVSKLMDLGTIEFELDKGYRLSDPLLGQYLARH